MLTEHRTKFDYLLNALERASQAAKPAEHGYGVKREALFAYVRDLERQAALLASSSAAREDTERLDWIESIIRKQGAVLAVALRGRLAIRASAVARSVAQGRSRQLPYRQRAPRSFGRRP